MVTWEFDGKIFKESNPPLMLRHLLHYDALASLLCIKFRDKIDNGVILAGLYFFVVMDVVKSQEVTSYEVLGKD